MKFLRNSSKFNYSDLKLYVSGNTRIFLDAIKPSDLSRKYIISYSQSTIVVAKAKPHLPSLVN